MLGDAFVGGGSFEEHEGVEAIVLGRRELEESICRAFGRDRIDVSTRQLDERASHGKPTQRLEDLLRGFIEHPLVEGAERTKPYEENFVST